MPSNHGPALPRVLTDELPARSSERATCPRGCGELRFATDPLGYTVERCDRCGHRLRIVASRTARPEPPTSAPVHTRAPRGEFTARLSALLPDTPEAALPLRVLVARSGLPLNKVSAMLAHWKRRDKVGVVAGIRVTPSGRTKVWHYFRKVA